MANKKYLTLVEAYLSRHERGGFLVGDVFKFNIRSFNSKCFILVDPFKKVSDRNKFLYKIKNIYSGQKKYIIAVNNFKGKFPKNFREIYSIIGSKTRSLKIFETI